MACKKRSKLAQVVKTHRDFHLKTGFIADKGVRLLGLHSCPLTSPLYKLVKAIGYTNVALASIALVFLED